MPKLLLIEYAKKKLENFNLEDSLDAEGIDSSLQYNGSRVKASDLLIKIAVGLKDLVATDYDLEPYISFAFYGWKLASFAADPTHKAFDRQFDKNAKTLRKLMKINKIKLSLKQVDKYLILACYLKLTYFKELNLLLKDYRYVPDPMDDSMQKLQVAVLYPDELNI